MSYHLKLTGFAMLIGICALSSAAQSALVAHWTLDNGNTGVGGGLTNLGTDGATSDLATFGATPGFSSTGGFDGGGYASFDGATQALRANSAGNAADDLASYPFSFAAWIRPTGTIGPPASPSRAAIVSIGNNASTQRYYALEMGYGDATNSGDLEAVRRSTSFTDFNANSSYATLTDGAWHHVAVVMSGPMAVKMYIDGAPVTSTTPASPASVSFDATINSIAIGTLARSSAVDFWKGDIDDVRLYDEALTDEQVAAIPEPSSMSLIVLSVCLLMAGKRLRSSKD